MKIFSHILAPLMAVALLAACSEKRDFTVEGTVDRLGTQNLTMIYYDGSALKAETATAVDSKFTFTGSSKQNTVVEVYNNAKSLIGRFVAKNGDKLTVELKPADPLYLAAKGNKLSERLAAFLGANSAETLQESIRRQVEESPGDPLSALLTVYYYDHWADPEQAIEMFEAVDLSQLAPGAGAGLAETLRIAVSQTDTVPSLTLMTAADTLVTIDPADKVSRLLWFDDTRMLADSVAENIGKAVKRSDATLVNIRMFPDTFSWAKTRSKLPEASLKLWAPAGVAQPALAPLAIPTLPYYIVTDTLGAITYRGADLDEALTRLPSKK